MKLTWDDDDPERARLTKRTLTKKEIEEADFRAYIASSESEDEDGGDSKAAKRARIRALLLGDGLAPEGWGKDHDKAREMEITFTPGLSTKNEMVNEEEETTMQRYLRKQREKRKKKKTVKTDAIEAEKAESKVEDEFFEDDSEEEEEEELAKKRNGKVSKKHAKAVAAAPRVQATVEELELVASSVKPSDEPKHFDMKSILKAEKATSRKPRKKDKKKLKGDEAELQEDFKINVKDERFKALHEDHAYAIDPTNPQ